jgi:sterol desaturase/sphingolipid hydroxylase (fatty acid hydroxylase superfamily)
LPTAVSKKKEMKIMEETIMTLFNTPVPYAKEIWQACQYYAVTYFPITSPLTSSVFWTCFIVTSIVPMIFFYLYGFVFYLVDMFSSESFKYNHKVQNNIRINSSQYRNAFVISLRNWFLLNFPYLILVCKINEATNSEFSLNNNFPTIGILLRDLIVYVIIEEIMFYFSHRVLHWGSFYASIHKFHHTFTAPCAIAAIYAHPIEHLVSNVIPVSMGPLLMKSHPVSSMIWGILALFNTMTVHSGYDFSS